jgi:hypothetical protein
LGHRLFAFKFLLDDAGGDLVPFALPFGLRGRVRFCIFPWEIVCRWGWALLTGNPFLLRLFKLIEK